MVWNLHELIVDTLRNGQTVIPLAAVSPHAESTVAFLPHIVREPKSLWISDDFSGEATYSRQK